ncbi:MAG: NnrS family protein [Leptospira sp.]|nr:NnrS family protein [Leptospira sp.]
MDLKSQLSRSLIFYGMIPCIITGAGAKIINVIVNTDSPQSRMQWMQKAESSSSSFLISIIFALSFVLEIILIKNIYSDYSIIFRIIRFSIIVFWLVNFFHILDISAFTSKLSKLILISSYLLIFGYAGHTFKTAYSVHLAHIYFIGGISLVILCIMTRVALSHGQADIVIEKKSAIFYWILGFIVVATATRATAIFVTNQYFSHLAYSSIFFIIAMLIWGIFILRQLNSGSQD